MASVRDLPNYASLPEAQTKAYAESLDSQDPLQHLRDEFIIPTIEDLQRDTISREGINKDSPKSIYLCGNSLGLQPRLTSERIRAYLDQWSTKGVFGHFKLLKESSELPPWVDIDDAAAAKMAGIVGAAPNEVAVMGTLTANLHLAMASFYRPTKERWKIILEGRAFPSDHYAVESQIRHHNFNVDDSMLLIEPDSAEHPTLSTEKILSIIDRHASTTALLLLPGIQYYTGQYFDIPLITAHAHSKGIMVGWDLAHAVGNVDVRLHDWNVDFAVWCNYKYMNSGPGAIAGMFVHEKHGKVDMEQLQSGQGGYRPRLTGWWGGDKSIRFKMANRFVPIPGAAGFQVSNPSALDLTSVLASLEIFHKTTMKDLRAKSIKLTGYLEYLLNQACSSLLSENEKDTSSIKSALPFSIITPTDPHFRGAQLSVRLSPDMLELVMVELEKHGVVVDERRPDVIRVAPTPLYNTFTDVWNFVHIFQDACSHAQTQLGDGRDPADVGKDGTLMRDTEDQKGWKEIK
ncbi:kynureninase [Xylona heveae TC161]|uniref:Kynureninase n=1 Tax=Xylona heveae (strain CBS 132557 / TC161) TaxID=1328760 RepID=A0A165GXX4_XYLHT|nr:kynureninase [Xylona heveae TC161]KZF22741.1 kynureninase [Xylona heveae TC161]